MQEIDEKLEKFKEAHLKNLKFKVLEKTIPLGIILPEHKSPLSKCKPRSLSKGEDQHSKIEYQKSITIGEVKEYFPNEHGFMQLEGDQMIIHKANNVFYSEKEKNSQPSHIERPYIYVNKVLDKQKTKEQTEVMQKYLKKRDRALSTGGGMSKRNQLQQLNEQKMFWNPSTNIENTFLNTSKKKVPKKIYGNLKEKFALMTQEEKEMFQTQAQNSADIILNFFKEIRKLIKSQKYQKQIPLELTQRLSTPIIHQIWKKYCEINNVVLDRKTPHILGIYKQSEFNLEHFIFFNSLPQIYHLKVDRNEFRSFIISLGYDSERQKEIDFFYNSVFDEIAFQDEVVPAFTSFQSDSKPPGAALLRKQELISLRAFFWNFIRYDQKKTKVDNQFSKNQGKKYNQQIKEDLSPYKNMYKKLQENLKQLKQDELSMLTTIKDLDQGLVSRVYDIVQDRNFRVRLKKIIACNLYKKLDTSMLDFSELKTDFMTKILKTSEKMALLEEFIEGFIIYKQTQYISHEESTQADKLKQLEFNLCDFAEYIRKVEYKREEIETIITFIKKAYTFKNRNLCGGIKVGHLSQFCEHYQEKKFENFQIYKHFLEQINQKLEKQIKLTEEQLHNTNQTMYDQYPSEFNSSVRKEILKIQQFNITGYCVLKFLRKEEQKILKDFFIVNSLIKLINNYQNERLQGSIQNEEEVQAHLKKKIQQNLNILSIPREFTNKYIFSDIILVVSRKMCADIQQKQQTEKWNFDINKALQIFSFEAAKLKEVLYQWKYPSQEVSELAKDQDELDELPEADEIVPQDEGKVINMLDQVEKIHQDIARNMVKQSSAEQFNKKFSKKIDPNIELFMQQQKSKIYLMEKQLSKINIDNKSDNFKQQVPTSEDLQVLEKEKWAKQSVQISQQKSSPQQQKMIIHKQLQLEQQKQQKKEEIFTQQQQSDQEVPIQQSDVKKVGVEKFYQQKPIQVQEQELSQYPQENLADQEEGQKRVEIQKKEAEHNKIEKEKEMFALEVQMQKNKQKLIDEELKQKKQNLIDEELKQKKQNEQLEKQKKQQKELEDKLNQQKLDNAQQKKEKQQFDPNFNFETPNDIQSKYISEMLCEQKEPSDSKRDSAPLQHYLSTYDEKYYLQGKSVQDFEEEQLMNKNYRNLLGGLNFPSNISIISDDRTTTMSEPANQASQTLSCEKLKSIAIYYDQLLGLVHEIKREYESK